MDPRRFGEIKKIVMAALDAPAERREAFVRDACGDDSELCREVEQILAQEMPESFLERTITQAASPLKPSSPSSGSNSSLALDGGRFVSGELIAERYRVVGMLGRGGMGEVYKAEDLKLGEVVALKFLPESLAGDPDALARLHDEVRLARQISHRNVVRVHDIGDADGHVFLTMEFVDGEDLSSLLRRIGALPRAKALELGRQVCAGLAAAHDRGIVHRDLKPANVMVDGSGHARISDFGLATLSGAADGALAGTPAYMAPEQFEGRPGTASSDIYSLGLLLYEMFSGERMFQQRDFVGQIAARKAVEGEGLEDRLQPLGEPEESLIRDCLHTDPSQRPSSAMAAALRLAGGDPLAAAIAAGLTPTPEMLVQAPTEGALSPGLARLILAVSIVGILVAAWYYGRHSVYSYGDLLPRDVLVHRAVTLLEDHGWEPAPHSYSGFSPHPLASFRGQNARPRAGWLEVAEQRPGLVDFWYRESQAPLISSRALEPRPRLRNPPLARPGEALVRLDGQGRLLELTTLPPQTLAQSRESAGSESTAKDPWQESDLDPDRFEAVPTREVPDFYANRLASWQGRYRPDDTSLAGLEVRVDAAYRDDRLVSWRVTDVLDEAEDFAAAAEPLAVILWLVLAMIAVCGWLARRHVSTQRGDRRGAALLAFALAAVTVWNSFLSDYPAAFSKLSAFFGVLAFAAFIGFLGWLVYLALEPFLRRFAPRSLISWSRLLNGRWRDPLVGRDLLIGIALLAGFDALLGLAHALGFPPDGFVLMVNYPAEAVPLEGPLREFAAIAHMSTLMVPLGLMFLWVLPRVVLRRPGLHGLATVLGYVLVAALGLVWAAGTGQSAVALAVLMPLIAGFAGLVGLLGASIYSMALWVVPVSADPDLWWAPMSWINVAALILVAVGAYLAALDQGLASPGRSFEGRQGK